MSLVTNPPNLSAYRATADRVMDILCNHLNMEVPSIDTDLFESGTLDSLAFVNLLAHLEQDFEIKVSVEDLEIDNFRSVARIAEFVNGEVSALVSGVGTKLRLEQREPPPQEGAPIRQSEAHRN